MFTGIIKCMGRIESIEDKGSTKLFTISSPVSDSIQVDQSVSHDGVCLTVMNVSNGMHQVQVINETLLKSALSKAKKGGHLNLEKSISPYTLLDGHLVQGHVDTALVCQRIEDLDGSWKFHFNLPDAFAGLVIPQGSICLNGVSLTISDISKDSFAVAIIPYTFNNTNFSQLRAGDAVNVEFDLIGKYIIRQMELRNLTE